MPGIDADERAWKETHSYYARYAKLIFLAYQTETYVFSRCTCTLGFLLEKSDETVIISVKIAMGL